MNTTRKDFEILVYNGARTQGFDALSSKLIAILYAETKQLTLEQLSKKTEYSFSSVSTAMKGLVNRHLVTTTKKGGSRKLYFSIQRDTLTVITESLKSKNELLVKPVLQELPAIIKRCKKNKSDKSKELSKIIEQYQQQMLALKIIFDNLAKFTRKTQRAMNRK